MVGKARIINVANLTLLYVLLGLGAVACLLPFFWIVVSSLKDLPSVFLFPPQWIPDPVLWSNYIEAWSSGNFSRYTINTVFVSTTVTMGLLISCSLAAYAFARLRFPGRDIIFWAYLGTMMIPFQVTLVPQFLIVRTFGWIDTYYALIVPALLGNAFGTFLLRQFFLTIPKELEDAAVIDGCNKLMVYYRIIMPLSKPALATLGVLTFMAHWNDFIWPLIVINSDELRTLTVGLASLGSTYFVPWNIYMAGTVISLVPILVVFFAAQRYFVRGITLTGLTG